MARIKIASHNIWGIDGKSTVAFAEKTQAEVGPNDAEAFAIGWQEVFYNHQMLDIRERWLGASPRRFEHGNVRFWRSTRRGNHWRCLVPIVPAVGARPFGVNLGRLELSSGLVLCVRGTVLDTFFQRYRGGYVPDSLANKGVLAALVRRGGRRYAVVNTHFHNSAPDHWGRARTYQIEQLANAIKWIRSNWHKQSTILVGDFNIDSVRAYQRSEPLITTLYTRLISATGGVPATFWDVNAQLHQFSPVTTVAASRREAIDMHLLHPEAHLAGKTFATKNTGSDHLLTVSEFDL